MISALAVIARDVTQRRRYSVQHRRDIKVAKVRATQQGALSKVTVVPAVESPLAGNLFALLA